MRIPANLRDTVAFLFRYENDDFKPVGTGFRILIVEGTSVFHYLITCKHVVKELLDVREPIYVRLPRSDRGGLVYRAIKGEWVFHNEEAVDVAVLPVPPGGERLYITGLEETNLLTHNRLENLNHTLGEGEEVFFIGLFEPHMGERRNIPIVRHGYIAMVTDELLQGEYGLAQYYLLECQAFPFNSGSPVFYPYLRREGNSVRLEYRIIGIISGFFPTRQTVRMNDLGQLSVIAHVGISTAVPATRMHEILYGDTLVSLRKEKQFAGRMSNKPEPALGNHERDS